MHVKSSIDSEQNCPQKTYGKKTSLLGVTVELEDINYFEKDVF